MRKYKLHLGDCLDFMKSLPSNCIDAVVTDPPYGLKFMGKKWDYSVPSVEIWKECYRILKPGGHLLSFAGTRTYHRLVIKIEDAGFEIRDMIAWIYGQGFPKSLNISKQLDKMAGAEREIIGKSNINIYKERKNHKFYSGDTGNPEYEKGNITAPTTEEAKQWDGWGTALKPAIEPICLARKPIEGTVAENVLKYGTGGINIDGCRIATNPEVDDPRLGGNGKWKTDKMAQNTYEGGYAGNKIASSEQGRFPANIIHDGSEEVTAEFPNTTSGKMTSNHKRHVQTGANGIYHEYGMDEPLMDTYADSGSAARFFYCAKASKKDRDEGLEDLDDKEQGHNRFDRCAKCGGYIFQNPDRPSACKCENPERMYASARNNHPTVKPTMLMRYLCKLITPPNGIIIDPFMGSGSTGKAAIPEGFRFIGCELDEGYFEIAKRRIENVGVLK